MLGTTATDCTVVGGERDPRASPLDIVGVNMDNVTADGVGESAEVDRLGTAGRVRVAGAALVPVGGKATAAVGDRRCIKTDVSSMLRLLRAP